MKATMKIEKVANFMSGDENMQITVRAESEDCTRTHTDYGFTFSARENSCNFADFLKWVNQVAQRIDTAEVQP